MEQTIDWLTVARWMLLSRCLDELEVNQLTPQGKVKYQFSAGGHELVQILLALHLNHPNDAATVYYRSRPFMLASGLTLVEALAAGMARTGSPTEGRDVGVMFNMPRRTGATVLPASGDVGSQYTPAAGWAQAILYHQRILNDASWQGAVAVACGGEASVAANGFWAALNIATTQHLPLLFFIEDNSYGISVPARTQTPGGDIAANLTCYHNLCIYNGDGSVPQASSELIGEVVAQIRQGGGPCLIRMQVPRLRGHTFIDDQAYKPEELRREEARRDPLPQLKSYLLSHGVKADDWEKLERDVEAELDQALQEAENCPEPQPDQALSSLFFTGTPPKHGGLRPEAANISLGTSEEHPSGPRVNFLDAVRRVLETEMRLNPRLLVFGEDVGVKGGVHGATQGLYAMFGDERVFDTSLNEEGIIGRAVGMALSGLLPVPEIQFRKYADPATEQINDLGTLRWRTANKFAAPVVVRIPVGFGKRTGDPWHSVSGEAVFAHTLGWRIAYPSNAADAAGLLRTALRGDDPTFFFEHRALLDTVEGRRQYPGDNYCLPFGRAARLSAGDSMTVITWGGMVHRCLQAAQDFAGRVAIIDLRTIIPWDQEIVLESIRQTGKVLVVHEDTYTGGFAGEIIATIAEQAFTDLDAPIARLATPDMPIPYNIHLMDSILPDVDTIRERIHLLLAY